VLAENGVADRLAAVAGPVKTSMVEFDTEFPIEMATTFGVLQEIALAATAARQNGEFPLVLSGSCSCTAGALSAFDTRRLGLIWFDAHGDFHTPETTTSGFMGGLPLSIVVGHCWKSMAETIPGFTPLAEDHVVMVGLRDVDPGEEVRIAESEITVLRSEPMRSHGIESSLAGALETWGDKIDAIYVHLDLDVCDPQAAPVNPYQPTGGLSPAEVQDCLRILAARFPIVGASVTAYDPDCDPSGQGMSITLELIEAVAGLFEVKP